MQPWHFGAASGWVQRGEHEQSEDLAIRELVFTFRRCSDWGACQTVIYVDCLSSGGWIPEKTLARNPTGLGVKWGSFDKYLLWNKQFPIINQNEISRTYAEKLDQVPLSRCWQNKSQKGIFIVCCFSYDSIAFCQTDKLISIKTEDWPKTLDGWDLRATLAVVKWTWAELWTPNSQLECSYSQTQGKWTLIRKKKIPKALVQRPCKNQSPNLRHGFWYCHRKAWGICRRQKLDYHLLSKREDRPSGPGFSYQSLPWTSEFLSQSRPERVE